MHHRRGLRRLLNDDELLEAIQADWKQASLSDRRVAMLSFVVKLTLTPGAMTPDDSSSLRAAGFSDRDILDITEVAAYYAYANRIADGLCIATEEWIPE